MRVEKRRGDSCLTVMPATSNSAVRSRQVLAKKAPNSCTKASRGRIDWEGNRPRQTCRPALFRERVSSSGRRGVAASPDDSDSIIGRREAGFWHRAALHLAKATDTSSAYSSEM